MKKREVNAVRRSVAILLLIPLAVVLLHSCGGADCKICAMQRTYCAAYVTRCGAEIVRALPAAVTSEECGADRRMSLPTLVSEKVELRD